jgi:hypothetical protein
MKLLISATICERCGFRTELLSFTEYQVVRLPSFLESREVGISCVPLAPAKQVLLETMVYMVNQTGALQYTWVFWKLSEEDNMK